MSWVKYKEMLLEGSGSINYNKGIAKEYGANVAILLGYLCYKYDYWSEKGLLTEDGYFYITRENIEEEIGLSEHKQRDAEKILKQLGILSVYKKGMPSKNYYKLNYSTTRSEIIKHKSLNNLTTSAEKIEGQVVEKVNATNKEILIKETNEVVTNDVKSVNDNSTPLSEPTTCSAEQNSNDIGDSPSAVMVRSQVYGAYEKDVADVIVKWYNAIGFKRKITFNQIKDKYEQLSKECNSDKKLIIQQINNSYLNGYPGWYPPKTNKSKNVSDSVSTRPGEVDKTGYRNYI